MSHVIVPAEGVRLVVGNDEWDTLLGEAWKISTVTYFKTCPTGIFFSSSLSPIIQSLAVAHRNDNSHRAIAARSGSVVHIDREELDRIDTFDRGIR